MVVNQEQTKASSISDEEQRSLKSALPQLIAVSIKNVLLFGYGLSLGYPTILIPNVQGGSPAETIVLNPEQLSWIGSINLICVPLGCLFSGFLTQPLGRKLSMQLVNIPFIAAWLLLYFATDVNHLYVALCLTGLGGGLLEAPVITYVAEVTQPYLRGMLSAMSSMTILFAVFVQFLVGTFVHWRTAALMNVSMPIAAVLLLFIVPESPYWLVTRHRHQEAQASLAWLRGWTSVDAIQAEYRELHKHVTSKAHDAGAGAATKLAAGFGKFFRRSFLVPYFLVSFAFFLGHFSGVTTLQTYAVLLFQAMRAPIDKYYATLLLGVTQLVASLICVFTIRHAGKRILTFVSTIGSGLSMAAAAIYAHSVGIEHLVFNDAAGPNGTALAVDAAAATDSPQWVPMTLMLSAVFFACSCIRLLPWVLIGEVFPSDIRSLSSGFSAGISYVFSFVANKTFLVTVASITLPGTFGLYGAISLAGTVALYWLLPETEGRQLVDIENHFTGLKSLKNNRDADIEIGEVNHAFTIKTNEIQLTDSRL